jgi:hypothetical protein
VRRKRLDAPERHPGGPGGGTVNLRTVADVQAFLGEDIQAGRGVQQRFGAESLVYALTPATCTLPLTRR